MAKATKKTESTQSSSPKAAGKKKTAPPASTDSSGIDTTLAASNAAKLLAAGLPKTGTSAAKPSASFQNFKDGLSKPSTGLGNLFNGSTGGVNTKPGPNFNGGKTSFRNQTFGADVNRAGVPRRTGGG